LILFTSFLKIFLLKDSSRKLDRITSGFNNHRNGRKVKGLGAPRTGSRLKKFSAWKGGVQTGVTANTPEDRVFIQAPNPGNAGT